MARIPGGKGAVEHFVTQPESGDDPTGDRSPWAWMGKLSRNERACVFMNVGDQLEPSSLAPTKRHVEADLKQPTSNCGASPTQRHLNVSEEKRSFFFGPLSRSELLTVAWFWPAP